jgi:uncharacterized protein (DUF169 family)
MTETELVTPTFDGPWASEQDGIDLPALADLLRRKGRIRGNPVAISLFNDGAPQGYEGRQVEPCAVVRHAMDLGEHVYVDAEHHACLAGAWQAGFVDVPEDIRTGAYLAKGIPGFTPIGAARVKTGINVLPQGMYKAIGAAPLDRVPEGVRVDFLVLVCEPVGAATLAGVRTAVDGTPPRGAAGSSLCGELFAVPWHEDNVILTPGDMGGRMFNKTRPNEMFVIVPMKYAAHYPMLLSETPDVAALMESIKPGHAQAQRDRLEAKAVRHGVTVADADVAKGKEFGLVTTMPWDEEPMKLFSSAPDTIREFAGPTLEDYAREHGHERVTIEVMAEQMESIGMSLDDVRAMADDS